MLHVHTVHLETDRCMLLVTVELISCDLFLLLLFFSFRTSLFFFLSTFLSFLSSSSSFLFFLFLETQKKSVNKIKCLITFISPVVSCLFIRLFSDP